MNKLPELSPEKVGGKSVLVRIDAEIEGDVLSPRMKGIEEMVRWLVESRAKKIKLVGHNGKGEVEARLASWWGSEIEIDEDVRADPREEQNSETFAEELAMGWDIYVNDAFSVSHRIHTSVAALPAYMKQRGREVFAGLRLVKEVERLTQVLEMKGSKVLVIGGAKADDKARLAIELAGKFTNVLVGGTLGEEILNSKFQIPNNVQIGKVRNDGLDVDSETASKFVKEVSLAQVVVLAGPVGKFELESARKGTALVFAAAAYGGAYKVAGGGSTEIALKLFGVTEKFDWVSVGGGAMLEFLSKGTLPGIEVLEI